MNDWGLRGRYFRRFAAAAIILLTSTAAILDDSCCCCCDGGSWASILPPDPSEVDPSAESHLRSSQAVRDQVGDVATVVRTTDSTYLDESLDRVMKLCYTVTGSNATVAHLCVYAVKRAEQWVIDAIESDDGTVLEGTVPVESGSSGGGGGWD